MGCALRVPGHGKARAMAHTVPFCIVYYAAHGAGADPGANSNFQTPTPCGHCRGPPYASGPACRFLASCSGHRSLPVSRVAACRSAMPRGPGRRKKYFQEGASGALLGPGGQFGAIYYPGTNAHTPESWGFHQPTRGPASPDISNWGGRLKIVFLQKNLCFRKKIAIFALKFDLSNFFSVACLIVGKETSTLRIVEIRHSIFLQFFKTPKSGPFFANAPSTPAFSAT